MVRCWKTEISTELKRFYFIATICDPRQQGLTFPGVSQEERLEANEWFEVEYDSLWNTSAPEDLQVSALAPAASDSLPVPALAPASSASGSLGSFVDFMASVAHLQAPVASQVSRVKSEAHRYLELTAGPMNTYEDTPSRRHATTTPYDPSPPRRTHDDNRRDFRSEELSDLRRFIHNRTKLVTFIQRLASF
jgi:hypothetical protein